MPRNPERAKAQVIDLTQALKASLKSKGNTASRASPKKSAVSRKRA